VYKVVATLAARFDMRLADPAREWDVTCSWFARQKGLVVKIGGVV
jgi:hypothetical protein